MKTDIEIAQSCTLLPITAIGAKLGLTEEQLECYGRYKAKLLPSATAGKPQTGKLILVTAINPTAAGEGKTTTSIGLADSLSAPPTTCWRPWWITTSIRATLWTSNR